MNQEIQTTQDIKVQTSSLKDSLSRMKQSQNQKRVIILEYDPLDERDILEDLTRQITKKYEIKVPF